MSRPLKLILGLVVLQALALMVVLGITYWASQTVLLRFSEDIAARISRDATAYTEGFLDPANETAELTRRLVQAGMLDPGDRSGMAQYFLEHLRLRENLDGIYLGDRTGGFVYASRAPEPEPGPLRIKRISTEPWREVTLEWYSDRLRLQDSRRDPDDDFDPRTRPWYEAAQAQNAAAWTKPYIFFTSQAPGITVSVPVATDAGFAGVAGVDIKIEALSAFLESLDISPRGQAAIVAQTGDIIAHSDPDLLAGVAEGGGAFRTVAEGSDPILTQAAAQIEGGLDTLFPGEIRLARFEAGGEIWIGAVLRLGLARTPWTVVTYLPEDDILAPLHSVRRIALLVSLAALAATAGLGFVYGRKVMG
ncbi:MAG: cache domain-containing protein [Rhodobacter sp.]|nr:cache domain-containing protein [Rhodobacter sp.]